MARDPVFIVGVQRSGTTLLAAMLAAHSELSCGPETHFFRRLAELDTQLLCDPRNWPSAAVDFICSIRHTAFSECDSKLLIEKYQLSRDQIHTYLKRSGPGIPNILASVTEQYMEKECKKRWTEKTPDHIEHLQSVRRYFPNSPIVRIVRDPRDVALSLNRVPWGAGSFLGGILYWRRLDRISEEFFAQDERSFTLRFEDLVSSPRGCLERLCRFIGTEFEEGMLDTASAGNKVDSRMVPWKAKVREPVDASRSNAWREKLSPAENQLAEAMVGDRLDFYGYPREGKFVHLGEVFPTGSLSPKYAEGLKSVSAAGVRFWKARPGEYSTVKVFLGDPEQNRWLVNENKGTRLLKALLISLEILKTRLRKRPVYWIPDEEPGQWHGYCASLLTRIMRPHTVVAKDSCNG